MNDFVRGLQDYRRQVEQCRMELLEDTRVDPAFDLACLAAKQKAVSAAAMQMLDEVEMIQAALVHRTRAFLPALPAPPTPLHVESETYREDDRLGQVAEWMVARDRGRASE
jgi:hypothetical protein